MSNVYYEFTALLLISALVGAIAVRLRQPLIVAFIFVGILVGPAALGLVRSHDEIALLAQIGVTVLLFVVGLKLDLHLIRHIGPVALATGLGQLGFTIFFCFFLFESFWFGFGPHKGFLHRNRAGLFQHHHHCQTAVRQTGN